MRNTLTNAGLYMTHAKPCGKCGHPRGDHPEDGGCSARDCRCARYAE